MKGKGNRRGRARGEEEQGEKGKRPECNECMSDSERDLSACTKRKQNNKTKNIIIQN